MKKQKQKVPLWKATSVFTLNPFGVRLLITAGTDREDIFRLFKKTFKRALSEDEKKQIQTTALGRTSMLEDHTIVLWIKGTGIEWVPTLAHEANHVTHFVLENAGVKLCNESDEVFAYLNGFIVRCGLETLELL